MNNLLYLALGALLASAAPAAAQTTLRVSVPATTPAGQPVYAAGSFNGWQPAAPGYALTRQPDGTYQLTLPATVRGPQEFKFTRGSWATGEADASYQGATNRKADFGPATTLRLQVLTWQDQRPGGAVAAAPRAHTLSSNVRVLADSFKMPQLGGRARRVWLYLPPDYSGMSLRRYPVLYLQDGQNVFDQYTSFAGEWGVDETLDHLHAEGRDLGGCIVVAVDNGGPRRLDEYSPWPNPRTGRGGEGGAYVEFLVHTLKPYIDQHYRTQPGPASTGIGVSSMGALLATYAALRHPGVFGRVGVFSPAYWFAGPALLPYVARHPPRPDTRFYFVAGTQEGPSMVPMMAAVRNALHHTGLPLSQLRYTPRPDGQHAEWFWQREFAAAYQWLFKE